MLQVAGSLGAGYIWKDFMDQTLAQRPDEPFSMPSDVVRAQPCAASTDAELFIDGPPGTCPESLKAGPEWRVSGPTLPARRR